MSFKSSWRELELEAHSNAQSKGFWDDYDQALDALKGAELYKLASAVQDAFISQKLKLISDEVSEAHEGARDGNPPSKKIEGFNQVEEELADVVIRIFDLAGKLELDVGGAVEAKMAKNAGRPHMHGRRF